VFGGIVANTVYYITSISSPNISVSQTRVNGVAGANIALTDANGTAVATCYTGGNDIWNRISLTPW
jgi:hypothetical protein